MQAHRVVFRGLPRGDGTEPTPSISWLQKNPCEPFMFMSKEKVPKNNLNKRLSGEICRSDP